MAEVFATQIEMRQQCAPEIRVSEIETGDGDLRVKRAGEGWR